MRSSCCRSGGFPERCQASLQALRAVAAAGGVEIVSGQRCLLHAPAGRQAGGGAADERHAAGRAVAGGGGLIVAHQGCVPADRKVKSERCASVSFIDKR